MADQPPPGRAPEPTGPPAPEPTGVAPTGAAPTRPGTPGTPATPSPAPGVNPYPTDPRYLPGIDPARAGKYTVQSGLLLPAASRADGCADSLLALSAGLAQGAPAGMAGFRTATQAGSLADSWSRELALVSEAARQCATKIRTTTNAYLEAEARNAGNLR
ncbi:hypothetical protein [Streptodolium elevatio]|uniref:Uncharacterized protein n=1 Tax=Streptodolium elevatio TaxID=3157996 RepID=A0ABV3DBD5_9ACTN